MANTEKPGKIADGINAKLDTLHERGSFGNPLSWDDSEKTRTQREIVFQDVSEKLASYVHVPKTGTVLKILGFGVLPPLAVLSCLVWQGIPADENQQLWVWGSLGVIAVIFGIIAAVVADLPSIDSDIALAAYTIPRSWAFSRRDTRERWAAFCEKFTYFTRGDENHYISPCVWGYSDSSRKEPFLLFRFHYDEVHHETYYDSTTKTWKQRRVVTPHNRSGIFMFLPECKSRFRITEIGGKAGFDSNIKLEYADLNEAVEIYCEAGDELAVRKFLSPAVEEIMLQMSKDIPGLLLDFFPGLLLVITSDNHFVDIGGITLDERAPKFLEIVQPTIGRLESFRTLIEERVKRTRKYN